MVRSRIRCFMMNINSDNVRDNVRKLHLGCGKRDFGRDWIHIDGGDFPHLDGHDVTRLDLDTGSIDLVYASHLLQYFHYTEVGAVLTEWRRVLRPGGTLRLAVPDFKAIATQYVNDPNYTMQNVLGPVYGRWDMGGKTIWHRTAYDYDTLEDLLMWTGFDDIRRWDWRHVDHGIFDDHSQAYFPHMQKETGICISLNVEATKP